MITPPWPLVYLILEAKVPRATSLYGVNHNMCTGAFRRKMLKVQCNNQEQMLTFVKNEIIALHTYIYLASWIFEKVAPANLAIFTGTTLKPRFYDSNQPQNHTIEKGERKQGKEERERLLTLIIFILPTLENRFRRLNRGAS